MVDVAVPITDLLIGDIGKVDQVVFDQSGITKRDDSGGVDQKTTRLSDTNGNTTNAQSKIAFTALSNPRTFTLQTADTILDNEYLIYDESGLAGMHNITIATEGSQTINGSASNISISANFGFVHLKSDGTDWFIIGGV